MSPKALLALRLFDGRVSRGVWCIWGVRIMVQQHEEPDRDDMPEKSPQETFHKVGSLAVDFI